MLLTVGRMDARERYKSHDMAFRALPKLVVACRDAIYFVLGDSNDVGGLESAVVGAGVAGRVRFMGEVSLATLVDAYRMADPFVMPSTGEGFGIAFLEAMACGTPALGFAAAGAKDALADGELGAAVEDTELADTLGDLLQLPRRDPYELSGATRARFGRRAFAENVCKATRRLFQLPMRLSVSTADA